MRSLKFAGPTGKKEKTEQVSPLYSIEYSVRQRNEDADDLSLHELPEG